MSIDWRVRSTAIAVATAIGILFSPTAFAESDLFRRLLEESDLQLVAMAGFSEAELQHNSLVSYEHAVRSEAGDVEVRYLVRPLGRISIDYNDPHNAAPEPNHLFAMLFESLIGQLSYRGSFHKSEYSPEEARKQFNADWAAASVLDVDSVFATDHSQALVIGIHKDNFADAYTVILFDDYEKSRELIRTATVSLTFGSD